jgi:DNA-directed RNA polymerase specialized sigma24 family protein
LEQGVNPEIVKGMIFKKSRFGEVKNGEIAEELNVSVRTVEAHSCRVLSALRNALQDSDKLF